MSYWRDTRVRNYWGERARRWEGMEVFFLLLLFKTNMLMLYGVRVWGQFLFNSVISGCWLKCINKTFHIVSFILIHVCFLPLAVSGVGWPDWAGAEDNEGKREGEREEGKRTGEEGQRAGWPMWVSDWVWVSIASSLYLPLYLSISIRRALLAWETYVNIAKASEIDN